MRSPVAHPAYPYPQPLRALEAIEKRCQELQKKGAAARFIDKGEDAKEVARLIEQLQEAIAHYQVSGYQGIASSSVDM